MYAETRLSYFATKFLKDKSGVGIIVDKMKDCVVVNEV